MEIVNERTVRFDGKRVKALKPTFDKAHQVVRTYIVTLAPGWKVYLKFTAGRNDYYRGAISISYLSPCCGKIARLKLGKSVCSGCVEPIREIVGKRELSLITGLGRVFADQGDFAATLEEWGGEVDPLYAVLEAGSAADFIRFIVRDQETLVRLTGMSERARLA